MRDSLPAANCEGKRKPKVKLNTVLHLTRSHYLKFSVVTVGFCHFECGQDGFLKSTYELNSCKYNSFESF